MDDEDRKIVDQIVRAADVIAMDAARVPTRMTIKQRAESIGHLARLLLERQDKKT